MPETISFWWAAGGYVVGIVINVFTFGWALRGVKAMLAEIAADAKSALETAEVVRDKHSELALGHGVRIAAIEKDHVDMREELRDLVMLKMPNQVEEAMKRADASAVARFEAFSENLTATISKVAWSKRRR